jgi:hypothetical protein
MKAADSAKMTERLFLEELKRRTELEDGVAICLDCKVKEHAPELIILCPNHRSNGSGGKDVDNMMESVLSAIVTALNVPRNRMGKLMATCDSQNDLREWAVRLKVGGCKDVAEQAMKVASAILNVRFGFAPKPKLSR